MSLESYQKVVAEQREREKRYIAEYQPTSTIDSTTNESMHKNINLTRKWDKKILLYLLLVGLCVAAIVKNPTEDEARKQIKHTAIRLIENHIQDKAYSDKNNPAFDTFFTAAFLTPIYDYCTKTEVTDYFLFSSFSSVSTSFAENYKISGIIVFGKVIILDKEEI